MDPRLTKGILALAAAISAFVRIFFDLDDATAHALELAFVGLVGWLTKTPGDRRLRPQIESDAP